MSHYRPYPAYKDSGVEWLGEVPEHWGVKKIKYSFQIVGGATPKSDQSEFWDGDVVWVTPSDLSKLSSLFVSNSQRKISSAGLASCAASLVPAQTIILSTRAPIGSLAIAENELCTNQGCKSLVPVPNVEAKFYAYLLSASSTELNIRGKGTTFLELSGDELGSFPIPSPSTVEQRTIAAHLDRETARIDGLIGKKTRFIELLREKRQALITHAVTKGLDPSVKMKDSGVEWLGEVPEHWDVKRIASLYREVARTGQADLPVLSISIHTGISDDQLTDDERDRKVNLIEDREKYQRVQPGDLAYNMMRAWQGAFGTVLVNGLVSPAYVVAEPRTEAITDFIEMLLRTPMAIEEMRRFSRGIADFRMRLYWEYFRDISLPVPPLDEQRQIVEMVQSEIARIAILISKTETSIALLKERRSALITAAVTGRIDLRDAA